MNESDLSRAVWRKSSHSNGQGGACVEVAAWRKSRRSSGDGQCVEVATNLDCIVAVRDSKNPEGPKLIFTPAAWQGFLASVRSGTFDLS